MSRRASTLLACLFLTCGLADADFLYAVNKDRKLLKVDLQTYSQTVIGDLGKASGPGALFWDAESRLCWIGSQAVFSVNTSTGRAKEIGAFYEHEPASVAYDPIKRRWLAVTGVEKLVCEVDPSDGAVIPVGSDLYNCHELFFVPGVGTVATNTSGEIFIVGSDLSFTFVLRMGTGSVDGTCYDPSRRVVWCVRGDKLRQIDPFDGWKVSDVATGFSGIGTMTYMSALPQIHK